MPFRTDRFGSNSFDLGIRELIDSDRREDGLEATYNVSLDYLGGYVCDKCLLGDLIIFFPPQPRPHTG